jgi:hypothetical protein
MREVKEVNACSEPCRREESEETGRALRQLPGNCSSLNLSYKGIISYFYMPRQIRWLQLFQE